MHSYQMEFILCTSHAAEEVMKNSLVEFADEIQMEKLPGEEGASVKEFIFRLRTQDPTIIFDICAQFGRLKSVKVEEFKKNIWEQQRLD